MEAISHNSAVPIFWETVASGIVAPKDYAMWVSADDSAGMTLSDDSLPRDDDLSEFDSFTVIIEHAVPLAEVGAS